MVHGLPVRWAFVTLVLIMPASGGEDSAAIAQAAAAQNPAQTSGQPTATPQTPAQPATQPAPPAQEVTTPPAQPAPNAQGTAAPRPSPPPENGQETAPSVTERDTAYSFEAVIIVVLILGLSALLFSWIL